MIPVSCSYMYISLVFGLPHSNQIQCIYIYIYIYIYISEIQMLCASSGIVFLHETWLMDFDIQFLPIISDEFYAKGISSMDSSMHFLVHKVD